MPFGAGTSSLLQDLTLADSEVVLTKAGLPSPDEPHPCEFGSD